MVKGCGSNAVKAVLIIANSLLVLFGGIIFGVGIAANVSEEAQIFFENALKTVGEETNLSSLRAVIWVLVGIGGFLFVLGLIGCLGAACESKCFLIFYAIIIALFTMAEIGATIYFAVERDNVLNDIRSKLKEELSKSDTNNNETMTALKKWQDEMRCCGIVGLMKNDCKSPDLPDCYDQLVDMIKTYSTWIYLAIGAEVLVQIVIVLFSCVLADNITRRNSYGY